LLLFFAIVIQAFLPVPGTEGHTVTTNVRTTMMYVYSMGEL